MPKKIPVVHVWKEGPKFKVRMPDGGMHYEGWDTIGASLLGIIRSSGDVRIKYTKPEGEK